MNNSDQDLIVEIQIKLTNCALEMIKKKNNENFEEIFNIIFSAHINSLVNCVINISKTEEKAQPLAILFLENILDCLSGFYAGELRSKIVYKENKKAVH